MPQIYLKVKLYNEIIRRGENVSEFIDKAVSNALKRREKEHTNFSSDHHVDIPGSPNK